MSDKLDPNARRFLNLMQAEGGPGFETLPPEQARKVAAEALLSGAGPSEPVAIQDFRIPGPAGDIPIRIYAPAAEAPRPGLIYFHGGGWVLCSLETHDSICRAIAKRAGATVVAVDYRLAPEHKFPAAVDDCYAATAWVAAHAEELGIDPQQIAVGGDSAGGNLAAVISMKSRDEDGPKIAPQVLVYPVTDLSSFATPSYEEFADGYQLTRARMEWFREHYLSSPEDALNPHASPLLSNKVEALPPAVIITAECDPLRDEGESFAKKLDQAGVLVTYTCYPGMIHPFFSLSGVIPQGSDAIQQVAEALRSAS